MSLDVYSFGTLAFVLAHGSPYLPGLDDSTSSLAPRAHPRCLAGTSFFPPASAGTGTPSYPMNESCSCDGCVQLAGLERRFPTFLGNASITDLIKKCVSTRWTDRPTTEQLRSHALFTQQFDHELASTNLQSDPAVNFMQLLRLNLDPPDEVVSP